LPAEQPLPFLSQFPLLEKLRANESKHFRTLESCLSLFAQHSNLKSLYVNLQYADEGDFLARFLTGKSKEQQNLIIT
jgi:hypothetical protein